MILLGISGALVRHAMVAKNPLERWTLFPASIGLGALVFMTSHVPKLAQAAAPIPFEQVSKIFETRCVTCHAAQPTDDVFMVPPKDMIFESETQIRASAEKIYEQVVVTKVMPLGNKTNITMEERNLLGQWIQQIKQ